MPFDREDEIALAGGEWRAMLRPATGGALAALDWGGAPVLRRAVGDGVLDMACFPLVPFSNRIAGSRFAFADRTVTLAPNFPGRPDEPVLHGFGWLEAWDAVSVEPDRATLQWRHDGGAWPWPFVAEQTLSLAADAVLTLAVTNLADEAMPAGLGFHPYFPRDPETRLVARHRAEWAVDAACLPLRLEPAPGGALHDFWEGRPVAARTVDTAYSGREGPMDIVWPERGLAVRMTPDPALPVTVVYVPPEGDFFCAEPVSHATDALNRPGEMRTLAPGERWEVTLRLSARPLDPAR